MFNYYHKNSVHNSCSAIFGTTGIKFLAYVIILQYQKQIYTSFEYAEFSEN